MDWPCPEDGGPATMGRPDGRTVDPRSFRNKLTLRERLRVDMDQAGPGSRGGPGKCRSGPVIAGTAAPQTP